MIPGLVVVIAPVVTCIVVTPAALEVPTTTVPVGINAPVTVIPIKISLYSASKVIKSYKLTKPPTACNVKSPTESCNGFDEGFEVLLVGYKRCFIPAESTQDILV